VDQSNRLLSGRSQVRILPGTLYQPGRHRHRFLRQRDREPAAAKAIGVLDRAGQDPRRNVLADPLEVGCNAPLSEDQDGGFALLGEDPQSELAASLTMSDSGPSA
jgi:hypothetical protein